MVRDSRTDKWTDRPTDGRANGWTMLLYIDAIDASQNDDSATDFAIFTEALGKDRPTDGRKDGPTDGHSL